MKLSKKEKQALIQGIIAQLEVDLENGEFDSLNCMFDTLLKSKKNATILYEYLGDNILEMLIEGKLNYKY
jgi:hypothetical protein